MDITDIQIKELRLCVQRCNKAMATFDLIHKVIPIYEGRREADDSLMSAVRGILNTRRIAQEQIDKLFREARHEM